MRVCRSLNKIKRRGFIEPNSMVLGDCLEVMPLIQGGGIDLCLTDPPYGSSKCRWDSVIPLHNMWVCLNKNVKSDGVVAIFGTEPFSSQLRISNIEDFRYDWYWEKDKGANWMFGNSQPLKVIEVVSVFYKKKPLYNPQKTARKAGAHQGHKYKNPSKISNHVKAVMGESWKETPLDETQNYHGKDYEPDKLLPRQRLYFPREQRGKVHDTQKPVKLCEYLIKTYTNEGDLVLDFAAGSFTTAIACMNTNRKFIMIENDKEFFEAGVNRVKKHWEAQRTK